VQSSSSCSPAEGRNRPALESGLYPCSPPTSCAEASMTTPLIREIVDLSIQNGGDPVDYVWFDISGFLTQSKKNGQERLDLLTTCKPPFSKCVFAFRSRTTSGVDFVMAILVSGDDPEIGINFSGARKIATKNKFTITTGFKYCVDADGVVTSSLDTDPNWESIGNAMLGFISIWYESLLENQNAYIPTAKDPAVNRRRIAKGKKPLYDWRTVIVSPKKSQSASLGGTHASPRLHDRRGHLRKYKSGKTGWVKACKVGNAALGTVFHDYEVRPA